MKLFISAITWEFIVLWIIYLILVGSYLYFGHLQKEDDKKVEAAVAAFFGHFNRHFDSLHKHIRELEARMEVLLKKDVKQSKEKKRKHKHVAPNYFPTVRIKKIIRVTKV